MNKLLMALVLATPTGTFWLAQRAAIDLPNRVPVGERLVRLRAEGAASPTVVLEIGLGGILEEWAAVQSEVAKFARVVAYDRVGASRGKPVLTGEDVARELHAALEAAGIEPPYVLVGQSFGGIYIRVFASLYPNEVSGLVLLDPSLEDFIEWMEVHHPADSLSRNDVRNWPEGAGIWATLDQVKAAPPLADVPVVVVTGTRSIDDLRRISVLPRWTASHAKWAAQFPRGRHVLAPHSGHGVHVEAADLVVTLIRDVVQQACESTGEREAATAKERQP